MHTMEAGRISEIAVVSIDLPVWVVWQDVRRKVHMSCVCYLCCSLSHWQLHSYTVTIQLKQKIQWNTCHQMASLIFRFYKIQFQPGLHEPYCWSLLSIFHTLDAFSALLLTPLAPVLATQGTEHARGQ